MKEFDKRARSFVLKTLLILAVGLLVGGAYRNETPSAYTDQEYTAVTIQNLGRGLNTEYDDFALSIADEGKLCLFASNRETAIKTSDDDDIWSSTKDESRWNSPSNLGLPVNTSYADGVPSLSPDGQQMVFGSMLRDDGYGDADLYSAKRVGGKWTDVQNLGPVVNSKYFESYPCLSADGKTLYFVSDRPGGFGGLDLWVTRRDSNGAWSLPSNLGPYVNTEEDEVSPFIARDNNTLYFSSNGHGGMGGKDIFVTTLAGTHWSKPQNLGSPVNSTNEDEFFIIDPSGKVMYFASDRAGGYGALDIYAAFPNPVLAIAIFDTVTGKPLNVPTELTMVDIKSGNMVDRQSIVPSRERCHMQLSPGVTYLVTATADGYYPSKGTKVMVVASDQSPKMDVFLAQIAIPKRLPQPEKPVVFDLKEEYNIPFFVSGYYRLNVPENLNEMRRLLDAKLKGVSYIEDPGPRYKEFASDVEKIFKDTLGKAMNRVILPWFRERCDSVSNEYLEIQVMAYADPRIISKESRYVEDEISFGDVRIRNNDEMTNQTLSDLRAYYSMEYIDKMLSSNTDYRTLKAEGKIIYTIKGAGVDNTSSKDYDARRRVRVVVWWKTK